MLHAGKGECLLPGCHQPHAAHLETKSMVSSIPIIRSPYPVVVEMLAWGLLSVNVEMAGPSLKQY